MSKCPLCANEFLQQFVCVTCGAQKLHDHTLAALEKENAALQKDAGRYRWLRHWYTGASIDNAIDAAIAQEGK